MGAESRVLFVTGTRPERFTTGSKNSLESRHRDGSGSTRADEGEDVLTDYPAGAARRLVPLKGSWRILHLGCP